jgi:K+-transporting ATPase ATPase A chain
MFDLQSLWGVGLTLLVAIAVAPFVGDYLSRVYTNRPAFGDVLLGPVERGIYRLLGTSPRRSMPAREYMAAVLLVNGALWGFLFLFLLQQGAIPPDPTGAPGMGWTLAFHSASSFTTNTDFTHFTNETQLSEAALTIAWPVALFLSPATGLAAFAAMVRGFARRDGTLGNFYVDLVRTVGRVLLPISVVGALLFVAMGVPETLRGLLEVHPLLGGTQPIFLGPVASFQSISLLGTNGGGFYSANMASPLANPSAVSNLYGTFLMLLLPISSPFAFAGIVRRRSEAWPYLGTVLIVLLVALALFLFYQAAANPALLGIPGLVQGTGYPVGQELRFGLPGASAFQVVSVYANVGANNMAIGAISPGAQMVLLFGMFTQSTPGGAGTGFGMLLLFAVLAIFVGGLMVGRTPEYLGKKIETGHVKWSALALLLHPALILVPAVVAIVGGFVVVDGATLAVSAHTFTAVVYEFTSESANNGSALSAGAFNDATPFFNLAGGVVMLLGRFVPIYAMLRVGEMFSRQRPNPPGPGTLKTASGTFTVYLALFLIVTSALLFLPILAMGPLAQIL